MIMLRNAGNKELIELDKPLLDDMVDYMDDNIRENLHVKLAPCTPEKFLEEYLKKDGSFKDFLLMEFAVDVEIG